MRLVPPFRASGDPPSGDSREAAPLTTLLIILSWPMILERRCQRRHTSLASSIGSEGLQPIRRISPCPPELSSPTARPGRRTHLSSESPMTATSFPASSARPSSTQDIRMGRTSTTRSLIIPPCRYDPCVQNGASDPTQIAAIAGKSRLASWIDPTNALFRTQAIDIAWFDAGGTANGLVEIRPGDLEGHVERDPSRPGLRRRLLPMEDASAGHFETVS